ncbi:MAG: hypothetical protein EXR93_06560 [Gemmatimonadetes bacterium]|jgi:hypothetical protein|nr:hypothetical protein [Gemmatimonadota bacterium]
MSDQLVAAEDQLLESLAAATRAAVRNGTYALWLVVRVCSGVFPPDRVSLSGHGRRVASLTRRIARLPLPRTLRRALAGALREIKTAEPRDAAMALQQLVAPAREILGAGPGDAVALAARAARDAVREERR